MMAPALVLVATTPLWAIPSPDLVIGFFASAAQLLGFLSLVVGGVAYSSHRRTGRSGSRGVARWAMGLCLLLLLVSVAGNILQYTRAVDRRSERLRANLTRSSTEGGKKVGDVNLKVLSFSDQSRHPRGVETETLAGWLAAGRPLRLIDVREPEEIELGRIAGARHARYPDLRQQPEGLLEAGLETVLLCYSGNRSSELCDELTAAGYSPRFLIGGYEKWLAEGRELVGARRRDDLRDIPDYPGKTVLLDTPEVVRMVREEEALFVDVRYPGEFAVSHLPGAVNLPLRKMPTEAMWEALRSLPRRPIIAPCYDKRSSFYALILGLRLHRLGYEFRGRYTVPHEFPSATNLRPHVARWLEEQDRRTLLGALSAPLQRLLSGVSSTIGSLAAAILFVVLLLRLAVLPFAVKSERDQMVLRSLAGEIEAWKRKLRGEPPRLSRILRRIHRRERITPLINLVGTVVQILLFVVFFSVVFRVAAGTDEGLWWIDSLGEPDPLFLLPVGVGALTVLHLRFGAAKGKLRAVLHGLCGLLLLGLTFRLPAAVNLYLVINLGLLHVQNRILRRFLTRRLRASSPSSGRRRFTALIVPLRRAHLAGGAGNKAARLGRLMQAGLPVPDGFALTESLVCRGVYEGTSPSAVQADLEEPTPLSLTVRERKRLARAWKRLGATRVAVRSSGANEDGECQSYAGMFESVLNVPWEEFIGAVASVRASLVQSARASAYSGRDVERGGILVQEMVEAEYAGVLFTEHPDDSGSALVELVPSLGDALVSGAATPESFSFGRHSGRLQGASQPPIDLGPLLDLGRTVEQLFGQPQDIEWAFATGQFFILQARNITTSVRNRSSTKGAFERERHRLLRMTEDLGAEDEIFAQNELSELLPSPTPSSLSLMEKLWAAGGSTDLACRSLGFPYVVEEDSPPMVVNVFGRLYVHRAEERRRLGSGPGLLSSFRLARGANRLARDFREEFLPTYLKEVRLREALDVSRLPDADLFALFGEWVRRFVTETYVEAQRINIVADFLLKSAVRQLKKRGENPATYLSCMPPTVVHRALSLLPAIRCGERSLRDFLQLFGHRAPLDYELSQPRYAESPELLRDLISRARALDVGAARQEDGRDGSTSAVNDRVLNMLLERAGEFQALKEEAKHHALRELAGIRAVLLEIDARLELKEGIFYLTLDEIPRLAEDDFLEVAADLIEQRRSSLREWQSIALPNSLSLLDLESLTPAERLSRGLLADGDVHGSWVSGEREVVGRVRQVRSPAEIGEFEDGEILVARFTDPTWTPLFPRASGLVTEVGGWLSHAAIVAREFDIPAIVGASGAMDSFQTGDYVRLRTDGTVQKVERDRRGDERVPFSLPVALRLQRECIEGILVNLSRTGALVESSEELREGQGVSLRFSEEMAEIRAEVIRRHTKRGYALRFTIPLEELPPVPSGDGPGKN